MIRRRLLLISYYFPPDGGAGTQRAAKFCKYLPEFGWDVTVIAREGDGGRWAPSDPTLESELPAGTHVLRVPAEDRRVWPRRALRLAAREADQGAFDAALVTMSPFTLAPMGCDLQRDSGLPVVFDLRDPWTFDGWPSYRTWFEWRQDRRMMVACLSQAAGVVANTPEAGRCFEGALSKRRRPPLVVIPNGFDAADFAGDMPASIDGQFTIVITGSLFANVLYSRGGVVRSLKRRLQYRPERIVPEGRTPRFLLDAIRRLRESGLGRKIRVVMVGIADDATRRMVEESGVREQVLLTGYLPHGESVSWLRRADALFLPLHGLPAGARSRIVPGKTYEYLAAGKPILACLPQGDARELVERSGVGFVADPCDVQEIAARLEEMLELRASGALPTGPPDWVGRYERRQLTSDLAGFLNQAVTA